MVEICSGLCEQGMPVSQSANAQLGLQVALQHYVFMTVQLMNANVQHNPFAGQWMIHIIEMYYRQCQTFLIHGLYIQFVWLYSLFDMQKR